MFTHIDQRKRLSFAERRRRRLYAKTIFTVVSFVLLVGGSVMVLNLQNFQIGNIEIVGNGGVSKEAVQQSVEAELAGRYYLLVRKSNFLFYPRSEIREKLKLEFPVIKDVTVRASNLTALKVTLVERKPTAIWCAYEEVDSASTLPRECYLVDDNGFIFSAAPEFSEGSYIVFSGGLASTTEVLSKNFMPARHFEELNYFLKSLPDFQLMPLAAKVGSPEGITITIRGGMKIYLPDSEGELSEVLENLRSIIMEQVLPGAPDRISETLLYLDLRHDDKIFYK